MLARVRTLGALEYLDDPHAPHGMAESHRSNPDPGEGISHTGGYPTAYAVLGSDPVLGCKRRSAEPRMRSPQMINSTTLDMQRRRGQACS